MRSLLIKFPKNNSNSMESVATNSLTQIIKSVTNETASSKIVCERTLIRSNRSQTKSCMIEIAPKMTHIDLNQSRMIYSYMIKSFTNGTISDQIVWEQNYLYQIKSFVNEIINGTVRKRNHQLNRSRTSLLQIKLPKNYSNLMKSVWMIHSYIIISFTNEFNKIVCERTHFRSNRSRKKSFTIK